MKVSNKPPKNLVKNVTAKSVAQVLRPKRFSGRRPIRSDSVVDSPVIELEPPVSGDWIEPLRAPSGDLPVVVLDFANQRYWANGSAALVTDLLGGANADLTQITGDGMRVSTSDPVNLPVATGSLLAALAEDSFTVLAHVSALDQGPSCFILTIADNEDYNNTNAQCVIGRRPDPANRAWFDDWIEAGGDTDTDTWPQGTAQSVACSIAEPLGGGIYRSSIAISGLTATHPIWLYDHNYRIDVVAAAVGFAEDLQNPLVAEDGGGGCYLTLLAVYQVQSSDDVTAISALSL